LHDNPQEKEHASQTAVVANVGNSAAARGARTTGAFHVVRAGGISKLIDKKAASRTTDIKRLLHNALAGK